MYDYPYPYRIKRTLCDTVLYVLDNLFTGTVLDRFLWVQLFFFKVPVALKGVY